jgi:hypothetical protein
LDGLNFHARATSIRWRRGKSKGRNKDNAETLRFRGEETPHGEQKRFHHREHRVRRGERRKMKKRKKSLGEGIGAVGERVSKVFGEELAGAGGEDAGAGVHQGE